MGRYARSIRYICTTYKKIWLLFKPEFRKRVVLQTLLSIFIAILAGFSPFLFRKVVVGIEYKNLRSSASEIFAYVFVLWSINTLDSVKKWNFGSIWRRLRTSLSLTVYEHVLKLSSTRHTMRSTNEITRTISEGLNGLRILLNSTTTETTPAFIQLITILFIVIYHFEFAVLALIALFAICYGVINNYIGPIQKILRQSALKEESIASEMIADALVNQESIKHFVAEKQIINNFSLLLLNNESKWSQFFKTRFIANLSEGTIFFVGLYLILIFSANNVKLGSLNIGDFILVIIYSSQVINPIKQINSTIREVNQSFFHLEKMLSVMSEPNELEENTGFLTSKDNQALEIVVENLWFGYEPEKPVLRGLSFKLPAGKIVALVGESGAGKSTLLRLLCRFCEFDKGRILVNNILIQELSVSWLRQAIAVIPQNVCLFNDTIQQNVMLSCPEAIAAQRDKAAHVSGLRSVIDQFPEGWNTIVGERGLRLSGGERQRVAIARAVLKTPSMYIFDEPTSALDIMTENAVREQLLSITQGITTLLISHQLSAVRHADQILVIHDGKIVEKGSHSDLISLKGRYAIMWEARNSQVDKPNSVFR